ncbi:hypothetical protein F4775DRAFT_549907 [Biscogniauxia sp. FL1348]|nr:hypothetical protein F4775DRAFT_549907 [Biscogniauxia sp. FL1348]
MKKTAERALVRRSWNVLWKALGVLLFGEKPGRSLMCVAGMWENPCYGETMDKCIEDANSRLHEVVKISRSVLSIWD